MKRRTGRWWPPNPAPAAWLTIGFVLLLAPWMLHTHKRFGELIIVNDAGGYNLWRASTPEMRKLSELRDRARFAAAANRFEQEISPAMAARIETEGASPLARNRLWIEQAGREFKDAPGEWIQYSLRRAGVYWRPWLNPAVHGHSRVFFSGLWNTFLFLAAGYGFLRLARTQRNTAVILIAIIATSWVAHIPFQVVMRMRIPFTDPIFIALAAATLESIGKIVVQMLPKPRAA